MAPFHTLVYTFCRSTLLNTITPTHFRSVFNIIANSYEPESSENSLNYHLDINLNVHDGTHKDKI